tara:strand:+ start:1134 stop:1385 length:252 start_codon:yes stop_codon:yes gene_type:complete
MFNRREIVYHGDEIISDTMNDVDWPSIKNMRKQVLSDCDYMFLSDQTPSQEWIDYRQFLRDLPQQFTEANDAADAWNQYIIPE